MTQEKLDIGGAGKELLKGKALKGDEWASSPCFLGFFVCSGHYKEKTMIHSVNAKITIKWLGYSCRCGVFVVSGEPWELELHAQVSTLLSP